MGTIKLIVFAAIIAASLTTTNIMAQANKELPVVAHVDLNKYIGKWYDIAHLPTRFQKGCACDNAEYSIINETTIRVVNSCVKRGKPDVSEGKAFVKDKQTNAKLAVQFFWPFRGKYWIIDLADDYSYAVVGHPNRKYLWVLAREKNMDDATFDRIVAKAKDLGFPTAHLQRTNQACGAE